MSENGITIIVCFYNAQNKLAATSEHLKKLDVRGLAVELIFVDNNSNDQSEQNLLQYFKEFSDYPVRIIQEAKPGLSYARLAGINASNYEYLLFCDDDNWLSEDYLQQGIKRLQSDKDIAVLGGIGTAVSDIEFPGWFNNHLNYYAVGPQAETSGQVRGKRNVIYGAGMFVRKSYFQLVQEKGFASYSSDRVGNQLSSGGDSEMCLVFQVAGFKIWYDESLTFKHYIEPSRLTLDYLNRLKKGMANSRFLIRFYLEYLNGYRPKVSEMFWVKELFYNMKDGFINLFSLNRKALQRNLAFGKYLWKEQKQYNKNVKALLHFCDELQTIKQNHKP